VCGGFSERDVDVGEVRLRCGSIGPAEGTLVVLLHGFPEIWLTWKPTMRILARAGYRAVAPDLRGYDRSGKPRGVEAYSILRLAGDVAGLVRAEGAERAHVVGHDWGGMVAWATATYRPEVVDRLAIVNAAHPVAYSRALRTFPQLRRSWYVFFFQLPWLPEWWLTRNDYANMRGFFRPDGIPDEIIDEYVAAMRHAGSATATIDYYRASFRDGLFGRAPAPRTLAAETLVVWGEKDRFLEPTLAEPPQEWVPRSRVVRIPSATHWAQIDAVDALSKELVAHFG
jgi:pimeloyl-ACP methyl ester carboxylesterase